MSSLYPLSNQVSRLSASAGKTLAHRFRSAISEFGHGYSASIPTKFLVGNPSALAAGRCYPNLSLATGMNNGESPLRLKLKNVSIWNQLGPNWVNHFNRLGMQYKFWSNPNKVNNHREPHAQNQFKKVLQAVAYNNEAINDEQRNEKERNTSPNVIASRPESFIHIPSIAGVRK